MKQSQIRSILAGDKLFNLVSAVLLIIAVLSCLTPFIWMILNSFKTTEEIFLRPISLPNKVDMSVFISAWDQAQFPIALKNSVLSTVITVLIVLLLSSWAAFPLARMKFRCRSKRDAS